MAGFHNVLRPSAWLKAITKIGIQQYKQHLSPNKGYQCACAAQGHRSCSSHALHVLNTQTVWQALKSMWQRRQYCQSLSTQIDKNTLTRYGVITTGLILLTGCGGGGGSTTTPTTNPSTPTTPTTPPVPAVSKTGTISIDINNVRQPVGGITYSLSSATITKSQSPTTPQVTPNDGKFTYIEGEKITLQIGDKTIGPFTATEVITQHTIAQASCSSANEACLHNAQRNFKKLALHLDEDRDTQNGYQLKNKSALNGLTFDLTQAAETFDNDLKPKLVNINISPSTQSIFKKVHGINTEELIPEGGIDISGQAVLMVDAFRHATPFQENSCKHITYDEKGWVSDIPDTCKSADIPAYQQDGAITLMLSNMPDHAIPEGEYTVYFEGEGTLVFTGIAAYKSITQSGDTISVTLANQTSINRRLGIRLQVRDINKQNPIKNIRIVMPHGICTSNPFELIKDPSQCLKGDYQSFKSQLSTNRNAIIFNPDYLKLLKNFQVVRAMNLMKASPRYQMGEKYLCPTTKYPTESEQKDCMTTSMTWEHRSKLDDAFWGATGALNNGLTAEQSLKQRFGRGAPLGVIVELMNQLKADPWFTIPHNADDDYVRAFADYVKKNLHANATVYLEYSNEMWNRIFWAFQYAVIKGEALGLDSYLTAGTIYPPNPSHAAYFYHAKRAAEIFSLWEENFSDTSRLVRLLGSQTAGINMTKNMLDYLKKNGGFDKVDGVAIAPYFYGCQNRVHIDCTTDNVSMLIPEAQTIDDIFKIIDNPKDPYGVNSTIQWIQKHHEMVKSFDKKLYAYEGGQHLTVERNIVTDSAEQKRLNTLFHAAQRDPRMKERYITLLQGWDDATGGENPFTLYTIAQGYHDYGAFGLLEHLNQPRTEAPKFDAYMQYMEQK